MQINCGVIMCAKREIERAAYALNLCIQKNSLFSSDRSITTIVCSEFIFFFSCIVVVCVAGNGGSSGGNVDQPNRKMNKYFCCFFLLLYVWVCVMEPRARTIVLGWDKIWFRFLCLFVCWFLVLYVPFLLSSSSLLLRKCDYGHSHRTLTASRLCRKWIFSRHHPIYDRYEYKRKNPWWYCPLSAHNGSNMISE